jgi:hypothetical protein
MLPETKAEAVRIKDTTSANTELILRLQASLCVIDVKIWIAFALD